MNDYLCFQGASTFDVYCNTPDLKTIYNMAGGSKKIIDQLPMLGDYPSFYISNPTQISHFTNCGSKLIRRGNAVKKEGEGIALMRSGDNEKDFVGVALQDISLGQKGDVQHSGYLLQPYFSGLSKLKLKKGTRIGIDHKGDFIINPSAKIAIVSDNQNIYLVKNEVTN
jgi:hypothetical protein